MLKAAPYRYLAGSIPAREKPLPRRSRFESSLIDRSRFPQRQNSILEAVATYVLMSF